MADQPQRPPIRIRFQFNVDTGDMEFIVDDDSPDRSEDYHDKVARAIGRFLARTPQIGDAGHVRYRIEQEWREIKADYKWREEEKAKDTLND